MDNLSASRILKTVISDRILIAQSLLLLALWSIIEISIPLVYKLVIDRGVAGTGQEYVVYMIFVLIALLSGGVVVSITKDWVLRYIGCKVVFNTLTKYIREILEKNLLFFKPGIEGNLIQNANDSLRIEKFYAESLFNGVNELVKLVVYIVVLSSFNLKIGFIYVAIILIIGLSTLRIMKWKENDDSKLYYHSSQVRVQLIEIVKGVNDIKTFNLTDYFISKWDAVQLKLAEVRVTLLLIDKLFNEGTVLLERISSTVVFGFFCFMVISGDVSIGTLIAVQYILLQTSKSFSIVFKMIPEYQEAKLSIDRINLQLSKNASSQYDTSPAFDATDLALKNVSFTYPQSDKGVREISLRIPPGSKVGIIGESGSGKSTILKCIAGLYEVNAGAIEINEHDIQRVPRAELYRNITYLSQESYIFKGSNKYNLLLNHDDAEEKKESLITALKLSTLLKDDKHYTSSEIDDFLNQTSNALSSGQKQRLLLARCFVKGGNILLLDEPTSALDNKTAKNVIANILKTYKDQIVIIASHKLHLLQDLDYVYLVDNGKIVNHGTPSEIFGNQTFTVYDQH